jgi:glycine cleavage system H protein
MAFGGHATGRNMSDAPKDYRYLETHEWHKQEADGTILLGITQLAADELTDVTYVALPKVGDKVTKGQRWGEIESVKATSDLYSGVSGTITAVNADLAANPALVNTDPYVGGWMIKIKPSDASEFGQLLATDDYLKKAGH